MLSRYLALEWIDKKRSIDAQGTPLPDEVTVWLDEIKRNVWENVPSSLSDLVQSSPFMNIPCVVSQQVSFGINFYLSLSNLCTP